MNDEPQWVVTTEEMGTISMLLMILLALPFIPPFLIGFEIGKAINDINYVKFGLGGLFAVLWYLVLKKVHDEKGMAALITVLVLEALVFDGYWAAKTKQPMKSLIMVQKVERWAFSK